MVKEGKGVYRMAKKDEVVEKVCQALREKKVPLHKIRKTVEGPILAPSQTDVLVGGKSAHSFPGDAMFLEFCWDVSHRNGNAKRCVQLTSRV